MAGLQHLSHPQRGTVLMLVATKVAVCEVACSIVIARPKVGFVRGSGTAARQSKRCKGAEPRGESSCHVCPLRPLYARKTMGRPGALWSYVRYPVAWPS